ncbi:MAG: NAD(+)/NADH kinase [Chloroflexia bacterium]|nr:NAD(+)/NADH kinase [Chloroflexia bacterium]
MVGGGPLVGIVANPASGKDIRRLVALGSSVDNNEKINIVRRVLRGLEAMGVARVAYMPDGYGIVERAAATLDLRLAVEPLPMATFGVPSDSEEAARRLADLGADAIVTLGGDGTNRVVALGCGDVPLVPISTGTNNVFPRLVEGTLAGLAAGAVAIGVAANRPDSPRVIRRHPRLDVAIDGTYRTSALIDVAATGHGWIGGRALWRPEDLRDVVLSRINPAEIGLASLGGLLFPEACGGCSGATIQIDQTSPQRLLAPIAPGSIVEVGIAEARLLAHGETVSLRPGPCTVALDGEREIDILDSETTIEVRLELQGPRVVEIEAAIRAAAAAGAFRRGHSVT